MGPALITFVIVFARGVCGHEEHAAEAFPGAAFFDKPGPSALIIGAVAALIVLVSV